MFGIPISKPLWYLNWYLTNAQVELLTMDVSVVDYGGDKKKKSKGEFDSPSMSALTRSMEKWKAKYGEEGNSEPIAIDLSEYMPMSNVKSK